MAAAIEPSTATIEAVTAAEHCESSIPVVVQLRLFVRPEVMDKLDDIRKQAGLDPGIPRLLWWMTMQPLEMADPYVIETCWRSERAFWGWYRDNAAYLGDIVQAVQAALQVTIWRVTHYAAVAER